MFSHDRNLSHASYTKNSIPINSVHLIERTLLLERIQVQHHLRKVLLVQAPAGFGKSSIMTQYLVWSQKKKIACFWMTLDKTLNDLNRFVHVLSDTMDEYLPQSHAQQYWGHGLIEKLSLYHQPFKIFLDDFESIQNTAVLDFVEQLIQHIPLSGEIIIGSRVIPEIHLGRIRIQSQLLEINHQDLRLSMQEIDELLNKQCQHRFRTEDVAALLQKTEGWPAAVYIASLTVTQHLSIQRFLNTFSGSHIELGQFLTEEILDTLPEDKRHFLIQSSILDELNADICNAVTLQQNSQECLQQLYKANLFLIPIDNDGTRFRFHGLFASFLQQQLKSQDQDKINDLHDRAATWYLQHKRPIKAIDHLMEKSDQMQALNLIQQYAKAQISEGRIKRVLKWFDLLQPEIRIYVKGTAIELIYAWALVLNRQHNEAQQILDEFLDSARVMPERLLQEASTIQCLQYSITDKVLICHEQTTELLSQLNRELYLEHGVLSNILAFCMIATNQYDAARQLMSQAMHNNLLLRNTFVRTLSDAQDGLIDFIQGRWGHALSRLESSYEYLCARRTKSLPGGKANIGVPLAEVLYELNQVDKAKRILAENLAYARENGTTDVIISAYILQAKISICQHEKSNALRYLKDLESLASDYGLVRADASAKIEMARLLWLDRDLQGAQTLLKYVEGLEIWKQQKGYFLPAQDIDNLQTLKWYLALSEGAAQNAIIGIQLALRTARAFRRERRALKLEILLCLAYLSDQKISEALKRLTDVLQQMSREQVFRPLLDEGFPMQLLLHLWFKQQQQFQFNHDISADYLDSLEALVLKDITNIDQVIPFHLPQDLLRRTVVDDSQNGILTLQFEALSKREIEVLKHLSNGETNKKIAEKLFVSETTVKAHLRNISAKLSAKNRTEAVAIARRAGIL